MLADECDCDYLDLYGRMYSMWMNALMDGQVDGWMEANWPGVCEGKSIKNCGSHAAFASQNSVGTLASRKATQRAEPRLRLNLRRLLFHNALWALAFGIEAPSLGV